MNSTRSIWGSALALSFGVLSVSCAHLPLNRERLVGTLVRVDHSQEGTYYTLSKGERPLTYLYLEVPNGEAGAHPRRLRITLLDLYSSAQYGKGGDKVSFVCIEKIPLSRDLLFSNLLDYKIALQPQE